MVSVMFNLRIGRSLRTRYLCRDIATSGKLSSTLSCLFAYAVFCAKEMLASAMA